MRRVAVMLAVLALATACSDSGEPATSTIPDLGGLGRPDTGASDLDPAPDFTVPTSDGAPFSLSDHLAEDGRPVFLNLWASWCFPCRQEMPAIDEAQMRHPGVKFIGVAVQDVRRAAEDFADEIGVSYTLGFDDDGTVDDGYRPLGLPATYIISADGVILERFFGEVSGEEIDAKLATWFGG